MRILSSKDRRRAPSRRMRPAILMYHRVVDPIEPDPWELAVTPKYFKQQIAYLKKYRLPMSMDEIVSKLKSGTLPDRAVALTFDDGYRDNLVNAAPILTKYRVPATFFIATGYTERQEPFWWDELALMILGSGTPTRREVEIGGFSFRFEWNEREGADPSSTWRGWEEPQTARQQSYVNTWQKLQKIPQKTRDEILAALRTIFPVESDRLALPMTSCELRNLVADRILTLGAHTSLHPSLTDVPPADCQLEMTTSKRDCENVTGANVNGFAYPYGHFSPDVRDIAASAGFAWACSTKRAFLDGDSDFHALPRIVATNCGPATFADSLMA